MSSLRYTPADINEEEAKGISPLLIFEAPLLSTRLLISSFDAPISAVLAQTQTINEVCLCAGRMLFAITVLVFTSMGLGYQQLQLIRLHAQLLSVETELVQVQVQHGARDMSWADNWIRELWNSKHRLRPVMHPDQTYIWLDEPHD